MERCRVLGELCALTAGPFVPIGTDEAIGVDSGAVAGMADGAAQALRQFFERTATDLSRLVAGGARILLSPLSHCYLDRPYDPATIPVQQRDAVSELGFGAYEPKTLEQLAAWDPAFYGIPAGQVAGSPSSPRRPGRGRHPTGLGTAAGSLTTPCSGAAAACASSPPPRSGGHPAIT